MKNKFTFLLIFVLSSTVVFSQNAIVGSGFSTGWGFGCNSNANFTYLGSSIGNSYILTSVANGTGDQYFRMGIDWGGTKGQYNTTGGSPDVQAFPNTEYTLNSTCTGNGALYFNVTSTSHKYIFKTKDAGSNPSFKLIIFKVDGNVATVSNVSKDLTSVYPNQAVVVTATLDQAFNTGQGSYLRYTTDNFTTSTIVEMTGSGTSYTATIPAGTNTANATVNYYVFTSGNGLTISAANADWYTINLNNNSGSNYSYTVSASYITKADGNWSSTSTWQAGAVPGSGVSVVINHNVTLDQNATVSSLTINSGKTFTASDATPRTLTISTGGTVANSGTFTHGSGTVAFAGTGTVTGTVGFNNVTLAGGVNFGSGSTINGTLTINAGGFVSINAPVYAAGSTLLYNTGGSYGRGAEWSTASGAGYPANVQIGNNTTLNVNNNANAARQIAGNLTVDNGSTFSMEGMTIVDPTVIGVTISGNIINYGTITLATSTERLKTTNFTNHNITTLSTNSGGDLELTGSLIDNATFNANSRAVFFTGSSTQDVSGTSSPFNIDYIVIAKTSGSVRMLQDLTCEGPNGGNAISFGSTSDILDLNGHTLTLGKSGVASGITGSGYFKGSSNSIISISGSGSLGTVKFDQTTPGSTNVLKNLTIDRTSSGSVTLGNSLTVNELLTTTAGTTLIISASSVLTIDASCRATFLGPLTNNANETGLVVKSGGSLIQNSAGVPATVERDIAAWGTALHGWHFLSAPVSAQPISPAFTNGTTTNYDFYTWWEPTNIWVNYKNTTTYPTWNDANAGSPNFIPGKGYLVEYAATSTKQFTGTLNNSAVTVSGLSLTSGYDGWNLVGNPFTSAIKWNDGSVWTVPANFASTAKIWNEAGAAYIDVAPSGFIPALNGFMVQVLSGSPASITIPATARVHNSASWYKSTENPSILLVANDPSGQTAQESIIRFDNAATAGFDPASDSRFLAGYAPMFYSMAGNEKLSTNTLPESGGNVQIPFTFIKNDGVNFTIEAKNITDINGPVFLKDLKTNTTQDLTVKPVYSFTSSTNDDPNRFLLTFSHVGIGENSSAQPISVYTTSNNVYVSNKTGSTAGNVYVYNMMGQLIMQQNLTSDLTAISVKAGTGYYLVKVVTSNHAYSGKVFINQ